MQLIGNDLEGTDRAIRQNMNIVEHLDMLRSQDLRLVGLHNVFWIEHLQIATHLIGKLIQLNIRTGRYREGYQYTCDRWMHSRLHKKQPDNETADIEEPTVMDAIFTTQIKRNQEDQRDQQRLKRNMLAIKERNDNDTANIVHHSQGRQEDTHTQRDTIA